MNRMEQEISRIAAYWTDQARRGCVDALECALREAWKCAAPSLPAAEEDARDAARYRWLRDKANSSTSDMAPMVFNAPGGGQAIFWSYALIEEALDAAIDAAMSQDYKGEV